MDDVFAAERLVTRAIQLGRAADGVEKIFQMRLVRRLVEKYRNFVLRELRGFANVHFGGVRRRDILDGNVTLLNQIVPGSPGARALLDKWRKGMDLRTS